MASSNIIRPLSLIFADDNEGFRFLTNEKGKNRFEAAAIPSAAQSKERL